MSRAFALTAFASAIAGAASAQPNTKPDVSKDIIGVWEGPYQSEMVTPGNLRLTVVRDSTWKVTLEIFSDQAPPAGELRDFTVNADTVSWVQTVGDLECASKAVLAAGVLKGQAECWQSGVVEVTAGFLLEKKK
ncbi:MAG: hypothetical protein ACT4PM_07765 [Gemmatimonadales bacterium]